MDDYAGVGIDTFEITVNNVVPTVDAGTNREYVIHDITSLDPAKYSDSGFDCTACSTLEDFTSTVNWGEDSIGLVNTDRVLTITLMLDTSDATSDNTKSQKQIDRQNAIAEKDFDKGDASRDEGDFDNTIQQYRSACNPAGLALKTAS